MLTLLYSFGIGLAFAGGAGLGMVAFAKFLKEDLTNKDNWHKKHAEWMRDHAIRVEDRLNKQADATVKIAKALEPRGVAGL